ncbi:protein MRVI1-like isoform X2, partial [Dinothrombium tinctorium]
MADGSDEESNDDETIIRESAACELSDKDSVIAEMNAALSGYKHKVATVQRDNELLIQQLTVFEEQNAEICASKTMLEKDIAAFKDAFERRLHAKEDEITELKKSLLLFEQSIHKNNEQLNCFQREKDELVFSLEQYNDKCSILESKVQELEDIKDALLEERKQMQTLIEAEIEQNAKLSISLREAQDLLKQKEDEIKELSYKIEFLNRELVDKENETVSMKQILQLVDVQFEDSNHNSSSNDELESCTATDEAVDCHINQDEFSSLESHRSSDTVFFPRTSSAINPLKNKRKRKKAIVRAKKTTSLWDELQSEHPAMIYEFAKCNKDVGYEEHMNNLVSSLYESNDSAPLSISLNRFEMNSSASRKALELSTSEESKTAMERVPGLILKLLDVLAKDTLKIASLCKKLCCKCVKYSENSQDLSFNCYGEDDVFEPPSEITKTSLRDEELTTMVDIQIKKFDHELSKLESLIVQQTNCFETKHYSLPTSSYEKQDNFTAAERRTINIFSTPRGRYNKTRNTATMIPIADESLKSEEEKICYDYNCKSSHCEKLNLITQRTSENEVATVSEDTVFPIGSSSLPLSDLYAPPLTTMTRKGKSLTSLPAINCLNKTALSCEPKLNAEKSSEQRVNYDSKDKENANDAPVIDCIGFFNSEKENVDNSNDCSEKEAIKSKQAERFVDALANNDPNVISSTELMPLCINESNLNFAECSKEEIETKYETLSLAFKTDRSTVKQRLELQRHQKQVAEEDVFNELKSMREDVNRLNQLFSHFNESISEEIRSSAYDLFPKIHQNLEVLHRCVKEISSRSKVYGAVKEELRLSNAFEVILLHVENLKREKDKEKFELKEARRLLINASQSGHKSHRNSVDTLKESIDLQIDDDAIGMPRSQRSISTIAISTKAGHELYRRSFSAVGTSSHQSPIMTPTVSRTAVAVTSVGENADQAKRRRRSMPASPSHYSTRYSLSISSESPRLEKTEEENNGIESEVPIRNEDSLFNEDNDEKSCNHQSFGESYNTSSLIANSSHENPLISINESGSDLQSSSLVLAFPTQAHEIDSRLPVSLPVQRIVERTTLRQRILERSFNLVNGLDSSIIRKALAVMLLLVAFLILLVGFFNTSLPPFWSWEEIILKISEPYITKEK